MLSTFRCHAGCHIHLWGLNHWGLHHCIPLHPWQAYVQLDDGHWPTPGMHRVSSHSTAFSGGAYCYSVSCPPAIPTIWCGAYSFGCLAESPIPSTFPAWWKGFSFPGLLSSNDTVNSESVVGMKPGDSGVVIRYHVDKFTCTWSVEWFVANSQIYPGFTSNVSSLTCFPLEMWCDNYTQLCL